MGCLPPLNWCMISQPSTVSPYESIYFRWGSSLPEELFSQTCAWRVRAKSEPSLHIKIMAKKWEESHHLCKLCKVYMLIDCFHIFGACCVSVFMGKNWLIHADPRGDGRWSTSWGRKHDRRQPEGSPGSQQRWQVVAWRYENWDSAGILLDVHPCKFQKKHGVGFSPSGPERKKIVDAFAKRMGM